MIFGRHTQKYAGIDFVCFSFHVGLLVITLSSLKLHTENNACMFLLLTGSEALAMMQFRTNITALSVIH